MKTFRIIHTSIFLLFGLLFFSPSQLSAQFSNKWMNAGSLHNWYSEIGSEREEGFRNFQQYGLQWPAINRFQDSQAARGLWIGAKNYTDEFGDTYQHKVVHVGPRETGLGQFFPMRFDLIGKYNLPVVSVGPDRSFEKDITLDDIDENMLADRMLINEVNTAMGISMTRKILQFSHQYHDNYIIYEYTYTNTGNTDDDDEIELPNQIVNDVYFFFEYRNSSNRSTRYIIGNGSGWGKQTMIDARGDGQTNVEKYADPENERFRAQFTWHGEYTEADNLVGYNDMGAPIWSVENDINNYLTEGDTVGRLGAPQFAGLVTLHADKTALDSTDDGSQPSSTGYIDSDDKINLAPNSQFNASKMSQEYAYMEKGHMDRHARVVEPSGNFAQQKTGPNLGIAGGFSFFNSYGPYTLEPGQSVKIVMAEAVSGLSRKNCIEIGKKFKSGEIDAIEKNELFLSGRDSLFQTFRRAIDNYKNGYALETPPNPPSRFTVTGGGDRILLTWEEDTRGGEIKGYNIYRSTGTHDNPSELIYQAGPGETEYNDLTPVRGLDYFYYIEAVGNKITANPELGIVATSLKSNRIFTQTYDPATLQRPPGNLKQMRVVPNPYYIGSASSDGLGFGNNNPDKISFFNIPGICTIDIYTESGEKINTIEHTDGSGDEEWHQTTSSNQIIVSGVYIAVVTDKFESKGKQTILKFVVIR